MPNQKKVGILTSTPSFINNYGAVLQAFALSTKINDLGFESYIIKYANKNDYVHGRATFKNRMQGVVLNPQLTNREKRRIIINKILDKSVYPLFCRFQENALRFYNEQYMDYQGLEKIGHDFYAFIVGSDQVWNPKVHHGINDPGYFLQFAPNNVRRIAYAPSMGVNELPDACKNTLSKYLSSFDAISIREETGRRIIKDVCGIDVPVLIDPTLLLEADDYNRIAVYPKITGDYILYYKFGSIKSVEIRVKTISKKYGYKVVCVPAGLDTSFNPDYTIGPGEFVGLIKNAKMVCTDSFHATAFSIIYNTPFISFCREDESKRKVTMNSRITDLLNMLSLNDAWAGTGNEVSVDTIENLCFDKANDILQNKRQEAIAYLQNALGLDE